MRIAITHATTYRTEGAARAIQALRLTPPSGRSQTVVSWQVRVPGSGVPLRYTDAIGNLVELAASKGPVTDVRIVAEGVVDTIDTAGVVGHGHEAMVADVCLRRTSLTEADDGIRRFAETCRRDDTLSTLHAILDGLHELAAYDTSATTSVTTAVAAFADRRGVCQDHAHIFIAAARSLGLPARYVTGYLLTDGGESVAHHAWAEALTAELGWVGFDAANGQCPTERYVRLAIGLDALEAAPIRGIRLGGAAESLHVGVSVQESQSQSQAQSQRQT